MLANHYNLLGEHGDFKRRKIRICPNSLEFLIFFGKFPKSSFNHVPWNLFKSKMENICHNWDDSHLTASQNSQKIHWWIVNIKILNWV